jgi:hypothetical protein
MEPSQSLVAGGCFQSASKLVPTFHFTVEYLAAGLTGLVFGKHRV